MNISLVICPFWSVEQPPISLAILGSALRKAGFRVTCRDLSAFFYNKADIETRKLWNPESEYIDTREVDRFFTDHGRLIDSEVGDILSDDSLIVGFSVYDRNIHFSLRLAESVKSADPGRTIVFGGPACYREITDRRFIGKPFIDVVVQGEAEASLPDLAGRLKNGESLAGCPGIIYKTGAEIIYTGCRDAIKDINTLPYPDFSDLLKYHPGQTTLPLQSSRGCIQKCVFCEEHNMWKPYRSMTGERIFEEISFQVRNTGISRFAFHDSLLNGNIRELDRFCSLMIDNRLYLIEGIEDKNRWGTGPFNDIMWGGYAVIRREMDRRLLKKMRMAGCVSLVYGLESASANVLKLMMKRQETALAREVIKNTHEAGINTCIFFMFGFPGETDGDFEETLGFVERNSAYIDSVSPSISFCAVLKGTYLDDNRAEFGISPAEDFSNIYWETEDGSNDYLVRMKRYESFCNLASSLKIDITPSIKDFETYKLINTARYRIYKKDLAAARNIYNDLLAAGAAVPPDIRGFFET
ncbi:MAG: radical SAM protein [Elusimicrobia bacterium]|nr:radical SAM protein [Elusimicrobiota bacterium]